MKPPEPMAKYHPPYPRMTSQPAEGEAMCQGEAELMDDTWHCTRERAHDGRHEAGDMQGNCFFSWPRPIAEVTTQ